MSAIAQLAVVVSLSLPPVRLAPPPESASVARRTIAVPSHETLQGRRERDAWFGDDKFRHFFMSFATTTFAFAGLRLLGAGNDVALPAAAVASAAAGIGKEIHDRALGRPFSLRDLVWDGAGTGTGVLLLRDVR